MLETYSGLKLEDLGNMTKRNYESLLNQVANIRNYKLGSKLEMETKRDKSLRVKKFMENKLNG